jgi:hypothetical protein
VGCSDDNEKIFTSCLLVESKIGSFSTSWVYNEQGQLVEFKQVEQNIQVNRCNYVYSGNQVTVNCSSGEDYVYTFSNNLLVNIKTRIAGSDLEGITTYQYLPDRIVVTINRPWVDETYVITHLYDVKNENFIQRVVNTGFSIQVETLVYSDALNPFNILMYPGNTDASSFYSKNLLLFDDHKASVNKFGLPMNQQLNGVKTAIYTYDCK